MRITILNPIPGGKRFTTLETATRYVAQRKARWSDPVKRVAIWFKATPEVIQQIEDRRKQQRAATKEYRGTQSGYAGPTVLQHAELRNRRKHG